MAQRESEAAREDKTKVLTRERLHARQEAEKAKKLVRHCRCPHPDLSLRVYEVLSNEEQRVEHEGQVMFLVPGFNLTDR